MAWSCWSLILLYRRLSSAKSRALECWTVSGKSPIYVKKRRGPRTVPRATPGRTAAEDDSVPSSATCCILPVRKDLSRSRSSCLLHSVVVCAANVAGELC